MASITFIAWPPLSMTSFDHGPGNKTDKTDARATKQGSSALIIFPLFPPLAYSRAEFLLLFHTSHTSQPDWAAFFFLHTI